MREVPTTPDPTVPEPTDPTTEPDGGESGDGDGDDDEDAANRYDGGDIPTS
jgi:hypothetical protein